MTGFRANCGLLVSRGLREAVAKVCGELLKTNGLTHSDERRELVLVFLGCCLFGEEHPRWPAAYTQLVIDASSVLNGVESALALWSLLIGPGDDGTG